MAVIFLFSSCATIIGGSKYYAKVVVPEHPDAKIEYKGISVGTGEANFKVKRMEANQFAVTIREEGCETQIKEFKGRKFRGWSFVGTLLGYTGFVGSVPLPWGVVLDGATGAWWKPDINEKGVSKQDYNHFIYQIDYSGCSNGNSIEAKQEPSSDSEYQYILDKDENKRSAEDPSKVRDFDSKNYKLRQLKKLLDDGILTQEEFDKEKQKILDE